MVFYHVVAYRWGWTNNSNYHVWSGVDQSSAIAHADSESHSRGGKYGCTVYELDGEEEKPIYHSPSAYGEKKAYCNYRIEMFEAIGGMVVNEIECCNRFPTREEVEKRIEMENKTNAIFANRDNPDEMSQFNDISQVTGA